MKKILSPLMAAALVTGLAAGMQARAEEEKAPADHKEEAAPAKGKKKMVKKHKKGDKAAAEHHDGEAKSGCDGKNGCEHKE